ncbi:MAG: hypothetical protein HKM04_06840 [Legionellales bacterium]|nr:hypothetical protein [Legionellales bacterium]
MSENNQRFSISEAEYVPTTLPGSRAPHVWLFKNGTQISTLDLFENEFVLLMRPKVSLGKTPQKRWLIMVLIIR